LASQSRVIADIHSRMVALVESLTNTPELREVARALAREFSTKTFNEGLGAPADQIDIDASARLILKRQILLLYEHRDKFSTEEKACLAKLSQLIAKL